MSFPLLEQNVKKWVEEIGQRNCQDTVNSKKECDSPKIASQDMEFHTEVAYQISSGCHL